MNTMTETARRVTGGVDTHKDSHVAAALDELGRVLGTEVFPATRRAIGGCCAGCGRSVTSSLSVSRAPDHGAPA